MSETATESKPVVRESRSTAAALIRDVMSDPESFDGRLTRDQKHAMATTNELEQLCLEQLRINLLCLCYIA